MTPVAATLRRRRLPGEIWVLHGDRRVSGRLGTLPTRVQALADWPALSSAFASAGPGADLVVVDPYHDDPGGGPNRALESFLHEFPSAVVVAAVGSGTEHPEHLRTLGDWGVAGVLAMDYDTSAFALQRRLEEARERSTLHAVLQSLPDSIPADARILLESALSTASWGGSVRDYAQSLHLTERTLQRRIERARLPAPRTLLRWMRLLLAARLLDDPGRTVISAALAAGYASDASLHRNFRISGLPSPGALRRGGALQGDRKSVV